MRLNRIVGGCALALGAVGCSGGDPLGEVGAQGSEVQTAWRGNYFDVDLAPAGLYGEAARATGAVIVPWFDSAGEPQLAEDGTPLRGTCGVTFISPKHAITAAHCVKYGNVPDSSTVLSVEMYRPSPELDWERATHLTLSGDYTTFSHPSLNEDPNYQVDTFECVVVRRCGRWGQIDCDDLNADVALLRCGGSPGAAFGYVNVASTDDLSAPVEMPWKHEVYDVPFTAELTEHYWQLDESDKGKNIHYFGAARNQLLPLRSLDWPDGRRRYKVTSSGPVVYTSLQGCHGTSGSGVMQERPGGDLELLGPVSKGVNVGWLCSLPGGYYDPQLGYAALAYTKYAAEAANDCLPGPGDSHLLFWLSCHRNFFLQATARWRQWPAPSPCLTCGLLQRLRHHEAPLLALDEQKALALPLSVEQKGASYRFAATALATQAGATLSVYVGSKFVGKVTLSGGEAVGKDHVAQVLSLQFDAPVTGQLSVVSDTQDLLLDGVTLLENGAPRDFKLANDRAGVVTIPVDSQAAIEPARFVGTKEGFAAQVEEGETLVFSLEALSSKSGYSLSFEVDGGGDMTCGLLDASGKELGGECSVSGGHVETSVQLSAGQQPIAVFLRPETESVRVHKTLFKSW